jgi:hypothetical protein
VVAVPGRALALAAALALAGISAPAFAQEAETPAAEPTGAPVAEPTEEPAAAATLSPSAVNAAELLAQVPTEVAGVSLALSTFEATDVLGGVESDALLLQLSDLASEYDTELDRLAIAGGGAVGEATFVSVIGARLPGVPAGALQESFIGLVLGPTDPELTAPGTVGGQDVTVVRANAEAGPENTAYLLSRGEVAWLVIGDAASLAAAIAELGAE